MGDESEDYSKIVRNLETHIHALEKIQLRTSSVEAQIEKVPASLDIQDIISRINRIQELVDRIEIEVDNLEMRVSSIEHVGFRLRTGGP
jgi:hypothetical protein